MTSIEELKIRARADTIIGLKGEHLPGTTERLGEDGVIVVQCRDQNRLVELYVGFGSLFHALLCELGRYQAIELAG